MRDGDLTYDDFLQRLNIQDVLIDAGYHLNRRDGLRAIPRMSVWIATADVSVVTNLL